MIDTRTVKMLAQYRAWADKVMFDGVQRPFAVRFAEAISLRRKNT